MLIAVFTLCIYVLCHIVDSLYFLHCAMEIWPECWQSLDYQMCVMSEARLRAVTSVSCSDSCREDMLLLFSANARSFKMSECRLHNRVSF